MGWFKDLWYRFRGVEDEPTEPEPAAAGAMGEMRDIELAVGLGADGEPGAGGPS